MWLRYSNVITWDNITPAFKEFLSSHILLKPGLQNLSKPIGKTVDVMSHNMTYHARNLTGFRDANSRF